VHSFHTLLGPPCCTLQASSIFQNWMVCDSAGRAIYNRAMTDAISPEFHLTPGGPAPFRPSEWDMDDAAQ